MRCNKRIFSLLLATILTLVSLSSVSLATDGKAGMDNFVKRSSYTEGQFIDVGPVDWFSWNVRTVYEYGLMNGKSTTNFDTSSGVTVAETITIASRLHAIYYTGSDQFETSSPWYQTYVDYALANQIIDQPASNYDAVATRLEFAMILSNALPDKVLSEINQVADDSIPDVSVEDDGSDAVYQLYRAGIMTGSDAYGTFYPATNIKRSEVAAVVSRMVDETQRKSVTLEKRAKVIASGSTEDPNAHPAFWNIDTYVSWALTEDGVFTFSGEGEMPPFYLEDTPWHEYNDSIKIVIAEEGCENISAEAFLGCNSLTRVILADSVDRIGTEAFCVCNNLVEVVLPYKMSEIGHSAFVGTDIKEIVIPKGITKLNRVFLFCDKLEKVTLPEGLETMGHGTFGQCDSLKTLSIPASVTQVSENFSYGTKLKNVYFYGEAPKGFSKSSIPETATIYFAEGTEGWTAPTWTAPDGTVYQTKTFQPE